MIHHKIKHHNTSKPDIRECRMGFCNNTFEVNKTKGANTTGKGVKKICPSCKAKLKDVLPYGKYVIAIFSNMLGCARDRARQKGIPFNLIVEDLMEIWPEDNLCPIMKIPLIKNKGGIQGKNSPSLDRIIPEKGYIKGNVQIISNLANKMKQDATPEEILLFSKYHLNKHKETK